MIELVRAVGGLLTIITLLLLVAVDVVIAGAELDSQQLQILVVLVGGLLGLDIMLDRIPVTMEVDVGSDESNDTAGDGGDGGSD